MWQPWQATNELTVGKAKPNVTLINGVEGVPGCRPSLCHQIFTPFIHHYSPSDLSSALHSLGPVIDILILNLVSAVARSLSFTR